MVAAAGPHHDGSGVGVAERRIRAARSAAILPYCRTRMQRKHGYSPAQAAEVQRVAARVLRYNGASQGGGVAGSAPWRRNGRMAGAWRSGAGRFAPLLEYAREGRNNLQMEVIEF